MTASQITAPNAYSRRLGVSLAVAIVLHVLLVILPVYRWLGSNPGDAGGVGGGNRPFVGTLLGSAVVIRLPEQAPIQPAPQEESTPQEARDAPPVEVLATEVMNNVDDATLAVELVPPTRAGSAGGSDVGAVSGGMLSGSMQPLGGGGVEVEMEIFPKRSTAPNPLIDIVVDRKIRSDEVRLQVLVDTDGLVIDHRVLQSIPKCPECTASAVEAALALVFDPPIYEGQKVRAWVPVAHRFGTDSQ